MLVFLKFLRKDTNVGAAFCGTFVWLHVINPRRLVIVVWYVIISVVLVVKGEINASYGNAIEGGWGNAGHLCGINQTRWCFHVEVREDAESVISIIDPRLVNERVHTAAHEYNLVSTAIRTVVRFEFGEDRVTVEPVVDPISALLLLVERHAKRDRLVCVVREGRLADQIRRALEDGLDGLGTEVAPQILVVVEEVLAPDLYDSAAVLWAVAWVDRVNTSVIIVTERLTIS